MPIPTRIPISGRNLLRLFPLLFLCGLRVPSVAQCTLLCNDGLHVSLDPSGQALITALLMAPGSGSSCPGPLTVTLYNNLGQQLPNPLSCNQIGQEVTVKVQHSGSGNFCTGTLEVYDALSPTLNNCAEKFIFCNEDSSPEAVGLPTGLDNCTAPNDLNFSHFDTNTSLGCGIYQNGKQVLKRIDRNWTVSDDHGNSSTCLQKIWLRHITFADLAFPANRDNISAPSLNCSQDPEDLNLTGQPMVNGVPVGASPECEIAVTYADQTIMHCAPAGFTVLRKWTAIDFCAGTFSNRLQIIKVEDKEAPFLIAPNNITVGTDGFYCTGSVTMPQAVFSDNCSAVTVVPSWYYGTGYGPFSGVATGEYLVTYTATDACGNSATATMKVTVMDSSPPQAICASDLQVSLSSNGLGYINASTVNQGSFDNCGPVFLSISRDEVEYTPQVLVSCADQGMSIKLTLKVTDAGGLENYCQMQVTVRDFLKPTVQCPSNLTLTCLQDYNNLGLTGQATATDNCALQSITHQDIVNIQPCNTGAITRWWTAQDSAGNTKTCTQQINIITINTTTVTFPANITVASCGRPDSLLPTATGQPLIGGQACSPLSVNYTDQVFSIAPPSCFRIFRTWKVIDHCIYNPNGGTAGIWEQIQMIDVVDHTPPLLSIPPDLTVNVDPLNCTGLVNLADVVASDCSNQITLSHNSNFSNAGNTANASGQYPPGIHFVTFTATDGCGNSVQKTLQITVNDNAHLCGGGGGPVPPVEGSIRTETGLPVNNIQVTLMGDGLFEQTSCDSSGDFGFSDVPADLPYILTPYNNANWVNGVTTYDLVLISKHILGTEPLNSPYKILAADANHSGSVTTFDVVQLRKVILGILDTLPNNTSWRFVDSSFIFPNAQNPFATPVPEDIIFDPLTSNRTAQNFIGLKVGDVNGSTNPANARVPHDTLYLKLPKVSFHAGETFSVPVSLENWTTLEGLQFELNFDTRLVELEGVAFPQPEFLDQSNIALKSGGSLSLSWDKVAVSNSFSSKSDPRLFTLHLKAKTDSDIPAVVEISGLRLSAEAYRPKNEEPAAIRLEFLTTNQDEQGNELKIFPNSSSGSFFVKYPLFCKFCCIQILDALGRSVWEKKGLLPEIIEVQADISLLSGLYFVELKGSEQLVTGKVMVSQ